MTWRPFYVIIPRSRPSPWTAHDSSREFPTNSFLACVCLCRQREWIWVGSKGSPCLSSFLTWPKLRGSCWHWYPCHEGFRKPDRSSRGCAVLSCHPDVRKRNRVGWRDRICPPWWASGLSIRLCRPIACRIQTNWRPRLLSLVCGSSSYLNSAMSRSRWLGDRKSVV